MKAPRYVDTPRLMLSQPTVNDVDTIFERYASDPEVMRFLGWPRHQSVDDTRAFLNFSVAEWEQWPAGPYLIRSRSRDQLLGSTGLKFVTPSEAMTGYVLAKDSWGHGYATEALGAVVRVARRIGVEHLYALCHPQHSASRRVLEKCGFARDVAWTGQAEFPNLAPGRPQDALRYVQLLEPPASDATVEFERGLGR